MNWTRLSREVNSPIFIAGKDGCVDIVAVVERCQVGWNAVVEIPVFQWAGVFDRGPENRCASCTK